MIARYQQFAPWLQYLSILDHAPKYSTRQWYYEPVQGLALNTCQTLDMDGDWDGDMDRDACILNQLCKLSRNTPYTFVLPFANAFVASFHMLDAIIFATVIVFNLHTKACHVCPLSLVLEERNSPVFSSFYIES